MALGAFSLAACSPNSGHDEPKKPHATSSVGHEANKTDPADITTEKNVSDDKVYVNEIKQNKEDGSFKLTASYLPADVSAMQKQEGGGYTVVIDGVTYVSEATLEVYSDKEISLKDIHLTGIEDSMIRQATVDEMADDRIFGGRLHSAYGKSFIIDNKENKPFTVDIGGQTDGKLDVFQNRALAETE